MKETALQEEKDKIEDLGGHTSFSKNNVFLTLACKFSVKRPFKRSNLFFVVAKVNNSFSGPEVLL